MTPSIPLTPLASLQVSRHLIPRHGLIPNTSIQHRPLLIYRSAFPPDISASAIESHLSQVGAVKPGWRYTMYETTHFHSTTHEVLCISRGSARLCLGGELNPGRVEPVVKRGDVVIMPAGVGHRLLRDIEGGFEMVGAYPPGKQWDMCYGREGEGEEEQVRGIKELEWFVRDPVYGEDGPAIGEVDG
ncbi:MAG: hypothetical protein M1816_006046 [Peltula sp. TS41687]|nr:MAG: hypothetical protein M1816_006046 [Peltula sp. TS41687]